MDYEQKIAERLTFVLSNNELYPYCLDAYSSAFGGMGLSDSKVHAEKILSILKGGGTLREREKNIWDYLRKLSVGKIYFEQHIDNLIVERRKIMLDQISPYVIPKGKIADYGAGGGGFMRLVALKFPELEIDGWDIVTDDPNHQVKTYDGKKIPCADGFYSQVYATTVLHHLEDPKVGAKEIARLSSKRIILIETIAGVRTKDRVKDWNITFVADYFWRFIHKSSEPVPGSYLTVFEWIELFVKELGCNLTAFKDFGNDQKTMTEKHVLFVFEK